MRLLYSLLFIILSFSSLLSDVTVSYTTANPTSTYLYLSDAECNKEAYDRAGIKSNTITDLSCPSFSYTGYTYTGVAEYLEVQGDVSLISNTSTTSKSLNSCQLSAGGVDIYYTIKTSGTCSYECNKVCPEGETLDPNTCTCIKPCVDELDGLDALEAPTTQCPSLIGDYVDLGYTDLTCTCPDPNNRMALYGKLPVWTPDNCLAPKILDETVSPATCSAPDPNDFCNDGEVYNIELDKCLPVDGNSSVSSKQDPTPEDLDKTFYSLDGCPTAGSPQPYVPIGYSKSSTPPTTSVSHYSDDGGGAPSNCDGFIWKCNYATKTFEKITYTISGNQCLASSQSFDGGYREPTEEDEAKSTNPCEEEIKLMKQICNNGYKGSCNHNGSYITGDTLECKEMPDEVDPTDCDFKWYESYNSVTKSCECDDGYSRSVWGICSKDLDSNATSDDINDKSNKDLKDALAKKELDSNSTSSSSKNIENSLSGIRGDLNTTNSLLSGIKGLLEGNGTVIGSSTNGDTGDDSNNTDSNSTDGDCLSKSTLQEMLDCYGGDFFKDGFMNPPEGFYDDNSINQVITFGSSCELETFTWNDGGITHEFPPRDFIESLPLEWMANFFIALLYISGIRSFLGTKQ